jgi:hypothetical protein
MLGSGVSVAVGVGVRVGGNHCAGVGRSVLEGVPAPGPTSYGVALAFGTAVSVVSGIAVGVSGEGRIASATNPRQ